MRSSFTIEPAKAPPDEEEIVALAELLAVVVNGGAAVSFLAPLSADVAADWWRKTLASAGGRSVVLVARYEIGICGTVQMHPSWAPNQPHRADVAKLMVHPRCRGQGLGRRLMAAIEEAARATGFLLLMLDTKGDSPAEQLYRNLGWTCVGTVPRFALDPDGQSWHNDVIFYKLLQSDA